MKYLILVVVACGLAFIGTKWVVSKGYPEWQRRKMCDAYNAYHKKYDAKPETIRSLTKFYDGDFPRRPYHGEWVFDHEDEKNPVKIYHWKYYICPKDKSHIYVKTNKFPAEITCEECGTKYSVYEDQLKVEQLDDLTEGNGL